MTNGTEIPDVYADQFLISVSPWGVAMTFGVQQPHPAPGQQQQRRDLATVRMSLEHAKIMAMMIKRQLKTFERDNSLEIQIPHSVYTQLGVAKEDW